MSGPAPSTVAAACRARRVRRTHQPRSRCAWPFRCLRRAVRSRGVDGGDRGGHRRLRKGPRRPGFPRRAGSAAAPLHRAAVAAVRGEAALRACRWCAALPEARKTSTTPDLTRSTTCSGRRCWRRQMGKTRVIAETGAGQHGVATATACALLGLECVIYMGAVDTAPAGAERRADAAAGRQGGVRRVRLEDAQGRHQRDVPRLGRQRGQHLLLLRHRGRAASVPD